MTLMDEPAVFFGSTDDRQIFVRVNADLPDAEKTLTDHGFTAHDYQGRTLYFLPPSTTAEEAETAAREVFFRFLAHTIDILDLSPPATPTTTAATAEPDVRITMSDQQITATARTSEAADILQQCGFTPATANGTADYTLPDTMPQQDRHKAVIQADGILYSTGLTSEVYLGVPSPAPADTTATPRHARTATPARPAPQTAARRTR